MDAADVLDGLGLSGYPAGIGGCRAAGTHFEACAHDIIVFDGGSGAQAAGESAVVWHASLSEKSSERLLQYSGLEIVRDESWELRMLLSGIEKKSKALYADHARRCLVESMMCCQKSRQAPGVRGSCWQKCATHYLADAICALNCIMPGPSHSLEALRSVSGAGKHVETVTQTLGAERATPTLLGRIAKSAAGLADMAGLPSHMIGPKCGYFLENSMPSDCYFYLGRISRDSFVYSQAVPDDHILRTAFDADPEAVGRNVSLVEESCRELLGPAGKP